MKHSSGSWFLCLSVQHSSLIYRMHHDVVCNCVKSFCNPPRLCGMQASSLCKHAGAVLTMQCSNVFPPCAVDPLAAPISRLFRVQAVLQQLLTAGQHTAQP